MSSFKHRLRHTLAGFLGPKLPGDFYSAYSLAWSEYVGSLDCDLEEAIDLLANCGYTYNVLGAAKKHPDTGDVDHGSYRRLDSEDHSKQWHVHLWDTDDGVEVFSHYEYKPEPWLPFHLNRSFEHYWPNYGETYIQGRHCDKVKQILEDGGGYEGKDSKAGGKELDPVDMTFRKFLSRAR